MELEKGICQPEGRGQLIVIDGVGGSGKTTQIGFVEKILQKNNLEVVVTREPGGLESAESIRQLIFDLRERNLIGPEGQMTLFFAARKLWLHGVVKPNIDNGVNVLTDRSHTSTGAYQGYAEGGDMDKILKIADVVMRGYKPDAIIFLDIDLETSLKRRGKNSEGDPFDKQGNEYLARLIAGYRKMAEDNWDGLKWYTIDGNQTPELVTKSIAKVLKNIFKKDLIE